MNKDLTVGKPFKVLWLFCLPLFGSIIFQQLYNLADSFVAGQFISQDALAAIGNSYEITLIFLAFATGCNIGCSVVVARLFGAKDYSRVKSAISTAIITFSVLCLILMTIGIIFAGTFLKLIKTPENIYMDSLEYLDIYVYSLPFVFLYNVACGIFTALGDSKTPFFFLVVSSISNILMDILFVVKFQLGVAGIAWATFICQGISCIFSLFFLFLRTKKIKSEEKSKLFSISILKDITYIAIPSILQQSFISVGNIIIQGIVNPFSSGVIAGYSASIKLNNLVVASFATIGNGVSNYTSQNLGAKKPERVKEGFKAGWSIVWIIAIPIIFVYIFFSVALLKCFIKNPTDLALETGTQFLRIVAPFYFFISIKLIADGILRGSGKMMSFMIVTFIDLFIRVVLALILVHPLGTIGIWMSFPIGWAISGTISVLVYIFTYKKIKINKYSELE